MTNFLSEKNRLYGGEGKNLPRLPEISQLELITPSSTYY
jgi:hypothetical protein